MARRPRDYRAEGARRNELARQRGYTTRSAERRAKGGRNYRTEYARRQQLAVERGYRTVYEERKGKSPVHQASQWRAYRELYPRAIDRTVKSADEFLAGFAQQGETGIPNRNGGYVASQRQVKARIDFIHTVERDALRKFGEVYSTSRQWWELWRIEYAIEYS